MSGFDDIMKQSIAYGMGEEEGRTSNSINWQRGIPTDMSVDYVLEFVNKTHAIGKWNGSCFNIVEPMHAIVCRIQADTVKWLPLTES